MGNGSISILSRSPLNDKPDPALAVLPAAEFELKTLISRQVWDVQDSQYFLDERFTQMQLNPQNRRDVRLFHLITHAQFNSGAINDSHIYFWKQKLTYADMPQLGLNSPLVELLTLSACQTAQGDVEAELGFAGAAVQAKVKTVLASLWSVWDRETFVLTVEFYRQLRRGRTADDKPLTKAEAFRRAQWALASKQTRIEGNMLITSDGEKIRLEEPFPIDGTSELDHPGYWSGLTLVGTPW